ncbi:MAG: glycosyltransferase [Oscillospiraceae bacterium]|nr:glycosyltransferase [Oscillospiraceae bacterium]
MKKLLVMFPQGFPYSNHEPLLEYEFPLYKDHFDQVLVVTACRRGRTAKHKITDPTIEILKDYTLSGDFLSIIAALPRTLTDRMFYRELKQLFRRKNFSFRKLRQIFATSLCANHRAALAYRWIRRHKEYHPTAIYSYWLHTSAYATIRLNQKLNGECFTISRAQGFDLYLERHKQRFIPFHRQIYANLDAVAVISHHGKEYLEERYGVFHKIRVHHLGVPDTGFLNPTVNRNTLRILTHSKTTPATRLNRLVDALSQIHDRAIHWTHIGNGDGQLSLERHAAAMLPPNVTAEFTGEIARARVIDTYQTQPFHILVNLSEKEGSPVSIMEAMSFGIPAIATAVDGTPELFDDGISGFLLDKNFEIQSLVDTILNVMNMPELEYHSLRTNAKTKSQQDYDAVTNFQKFLEELSVTEKL